MSSQTVPTSRATGEPAELTLPGARRTASPSRLLYGAAGIVLALLLWEALAYLKDDAVLLPTVQETARTFWEYMSTRYPAVVGNTLWQHALVSVGRIAVGWGVGVLIGVAVGGLMVSVPLLRHLVDPLIEITRPLPPLAFIPLFIVWFGIGETSKFLLILVGVVPIMIIATVSALDAVPKELEQAARSLGATPFWTLVTVRLRSALPAIITGMRLAMGGAWTSIVAVELIAATAGLGYLINNAGVNLQTPLVLSGIVTISIVGIVFDSLLRLFHRSIDPTRR
ncbi:ABC transporter permease [Nocardioides panacis]|uniref:ABC transporter permease n=1 Tax=Nocardioides panacis TaxID=2849501 RepID=A0A975T323_9ACTN|nr:ABC transporter permease [Nocardioides panacis]QWZ10080.1 ABC transporter permease [Nocardioides panacis]